MPNPERPARTLVSSQSEQDCYIDIHTVARSPPSRPGPWPSFAGGVGALVAAGEAAAALDLPNPLKPPMPADSLAMGFSELPRLRIESMMGGLVMTGLDPVAVTCVVDEAEG